jgi:hypothetical protein
MANAKPELLLSKVDVDRVFSVNPAQWQEFAPQMVTPGWDVRYVPHDSSFQIICFDPSTRIGLSVKPYFKDAKSLPNMVILGNYFPLGTIPPITEELKKGLESIVQKNIGAAYSVHLNHQCNNNTDMFEFVITKL